MKGKYSCDTAAQTLEWIEAIIEFLKPYTFLINAHVVNFFKDKLWEALDKDWIECLLHEPVQNLLLIPSGIVQDHWPTSLKDFVSTAKSIALPRSQADIDKILPDLRVASLGPVLAQGMNMKKKHEVEVLSAIVSSVAKSVKAQTVVDVGAGQGYLSQVMAFEYQLSVISIDASSHHGKVADARAERIRKHYAAQIRKHLCQNRNLRVPKTVICHVMSATMLKTLIHSVIVHGKLPTLVGSHFSNPEEATLQQRDIKAEASLVLTGLHACGDLSVTMLKSFSECEDIKAVVSLGCCYNLLSEEVSTNSDSQYGFPISNAVKCAGLRLGKCSRDLACQCADRWRNLGDKSGIHNFELHVFRAAFQMVLDKYYPKISSTCPAIGRQGKSLRRQKWRGSHESGLDHEHNVTVNLDRKQVTSNEVTISEASELIGGDSAFIVLDQNGSCYVNSTSNTVGFDGTGGTDKYLLFERFCHNGLCRLGLGPLPDTKLLSIWNEIELFTGLVGPYWSLLAALGPLVETLILLDRLLYLQEQGSQVEAFMLPVFNPVLSPRNVAIIAKKV
ncbi:hypothetical protein QQ045_023000 [Rhodiola kirilowii]